MELIVFVFLWVGKARSILIKVKKNTAKDDLQQKRKEKKNTIRIKINRKDNKRIEKKHDKNKIDRKGNKRNNKKNTIEIKIDRKHSKKKEIRKR